MIVIAILRLSIKRLCAYASWRVGAYMCLSITTSYNVAPPTVCTWTTMQGSSE